MRRNSTRSATQRAGGPRRRDSPRPARAPARSARRPGARAPASGQRAQRRAGHPLEQQAPVARRRRRPSAPSRAGHDPRRPGSRRAWSVLTHAASTSSQPSAWMRSSEPTRSAYREPSVASTRNTVLNAWAANAQSATSTSYARERVERDRPERVGHCERNAASTRRGRGRGRHASGGDVGLERRDPRVHLGVGAQLLEHGVGHLRPHPRARLLGAPRRELARRPRRLHQLLDRLPQLGDAVAEQRGARAHTLDRAVVARPHEMERVRVVGRGVAREVDGDRRRPC